jgi:uncharacterized SAM-dependent methyltransferase
LHESFSPARRDPDCQTIYERCFERTGRLLNAGSTCVIGLGCGGGQKDAQLIAQLLQPGRLVEYLPVDVGTAMVLTARRTVQTILPADRILCPLVCDLATADDLSETLQEMVDPRAGRLITFFGMIPNFEPATILSRLAGLLRTGEWLLLSANLAPEPDYPAGVQHVLPQYDNALTREWLMTFLLDLGIEQRSGRIEFRIEAAPGNVNLLRIAADFHFDERCELNINNERFCFEPGDVIRLFYSCRYTPEKVKTALESVSIEIKDQWVTQSGEEGVFLCQRQQ